MREVRVEPPAVCSAIPDILLRTGAAVAIAADVISERLATVVCQAEGQSIAVALLHYDLQGFVRTTDITVPVTNSSEWRHRVAFSRTDVVFDGVFSNFN